jgi:hypothetical protein
VTYFVAIRRPADHAAIWRMRMDGAVETSAMSKIYLRLLPFAVLSYMLAYIDRINVSLPGTMRRDL